MLSESLVYWKGNMCFFRIIFLSPRIEDAGSQERIIPFRDKSMSAFPSERWMNFNWVHLGLPLAPQRASLLTSSSGRVKSPQL